MKKPVVIFGTGDLAEIAADYFERDQVAEVAAFTVDAAYLDGRADFEGRPLVDFETVQSRYPPDRFTMFVALGYSKMNQARKARYDAAKARGYELISYISPNSTVRTKHQLGDNCFIFEECSIQPSVSIGNNVIIWAGTQVAHHSRIDDHAFVSGNVILCGRSHVSSFAYVGANSTVSDGVTIAERCLVGAGAVIMKDTDPDGVYVPARAVKLHFSSSDANL